MGIDISTITFGLPILLKGFGNTVLFCGISIAGGFVLAIAVALARISRRAVLRWPALWFIEVIRNTPFLVQGLHRLLRSSSLRSEAGSQHVGNSRPDGPCDRLLCGIDSRSDGIGPAGGRWKQRGL